jgi:transglutaminase-like putative cysteine protease
VPDRRPGPTMTAVGSLVPKGPEVYRPKGDTSLAEEPGRVGRILERMRPEEGWASLPLVLFLAGTMAWSIADARWVVGKNELTSFLVWIALAAALWGYVSARLAPSPWLAHSLGCIIGAFVVIEAVGASLPNADPGLVGWFRTAANSVTQAYLDLTWRHQVSTLQVGHFCLVLGIVAWGTAQAAAYDVFGYHRSVNGVLLLAVVLVANMALTQQDQFSALVVFSAAALMLLLLAHAADERSSWLRHRIWRGRDFRAPHLQGGMAFASVAVAGSLVLTLVASSAPLASTFKGVNDNIGEAFGWLSQYLPNGANSRYQPSADFGSSAAVTWSFHESPHQVFTIRVPSGSMAFHWRLATYDTFRTTGWALGSNTHTDQVIAGSSLEGGTQDSVGPIPPGRKQVSIVVHVQDTSIKHLVVANAPSDVNAPVQRTLVGSDPSSASVAWLSTDARDYTLSSYVPNTDPSGNGLTEWLLQHAGTNYPPGLKAKYTQGTEAVKSNGINLLAEIETWAHTSGSAFADEYDVAQAIQAYLHSTAFTYNADITAFMPRCAGLSTVDCFAYIREGFCEQYATTMTMLMRMKGFPARYVLGYLPGAIDQYTLVQQVTSQQKHAWVEVYFPTYGWIPFDPTGGGVGRPTYLAPGEAVFSTPTPVPTPEIPATTGPGGPSASASTAPGGTGPTSDAGGFSLLLVSGVLVAVMVLALFVLWRRRPRRLEGPESVYRNVVRLAGRVGYKPAPTQTVYEYTGMLADVVPVARDSLGVVAVAKVEATYGKRQIDSERLASLAAAQEIIRRALLRLALRMPRLRRRSVSRPGGSGGSKGGSGRNRR